MEMYDFNDPIYTTPNEAERIADTIFSHLIKYLN